MPSRLRSDRVAAALRARLVPLALVAGLAIALLPPLFVVGREREAPRAHATALAQQIADRLTLLSVRQPVVWRYNTTKIVEAFLLSGASTAHAQVRVLDCDGRELAVRTEPGGQPSLVVGRAYVRAGVEPGSVNVASTVSVPGTPGVAIGTPSNASTPSDGGRALGVFASVEVGLPAPPLVGPTLTVAAISAPLGLLVAMLLIAWPMRSVRRQSAAVHQLAHELALAQDELRGANLDLTRRVQRAQQERDRLAARVLSAQDEERRRIGRDLHDGLGQLLATLRMGSSAQTPVVDAAIHELRRVVQDLHPPALDGRGLAAALQDLTEQVETRFGVPVVWQHRGEDIVAGPLAANLLRITQEAVFNAARHAQAEEIVVRLQVANGHATLLVADDGVGFNASAPARDGHGLRNLQDRVLLCQGTWELQTDPGQGTSITVTVPLGPLDETNDAQDSGAAGR